MIYNVVFILSVQQSESVMLITISILFSHIGYYKLLSQCSCAMEQVLINHLFYTVVWMCYSHSPYSSLPAAMSPMVTIRLVLKSVYFWVFWFLFLQEEKFIYLFIFWSIFMAAPMAYGRSWARY